jgi:predicted amidohydrolase YtcJ
MAAIRTVASDTPGDGWIYGTIGERALSDPELGRSALDRIAPGRRVRLAAWTGHGNILSSTALQALGIGDRDSDPPFGRYGRTPDGRVDGHLEEYADVRAGRAMTALAGRAAVVASLRATAEEAIGFGITTIQAMGNSLTASELSSLLPEAKTAISASNHARLPVKPAVSLITFRSPQYPPRKLSPR